MRSRGVLEVIEVGMFSITGSKEHLEILWMNKAIKGSD
jgi:hypothetical protein